MADEELPEPRGLNWIAAWQALVGAVVLSLGLQARLALASGGFSGLVQCGLISAVVAVAVFSYLTRPHVTAAFGRRYRVDASTG